MRSKIIVGAVTGVLLLAGAGGVGYALGVGPSNHGSGDSHGAMHSVGMHGMPDRAMHDPAMHAAHHPAARKGR